MSAGPLHANLASGNGHISLSICGWGGKTGLSFGITFNSQSTRTSALGAGWTYTFRQAVVPGSGNAVVIDDDGSETTYTLDNGLYTAPAGCFNTLVANSNGSWTLTTKHGNVRQFRASDGMLTSITDRNNNTITLTYGSGSYLTAVTDAVGRTLTLGYTGMQLTSITDCLNNTWNLGYDGNGRVVTIADPAIGGQRPARVLTYDTSGNVNSVTDRLGNAYQYSFGSGGVIQGVTYPGGTGTASANFQAGSGSGASAFVVTWTDQGSATTSFGLDTQYRHITTTDPLGHVSKRSYDASNNVISTTTPLGQISQYTYDSKGNNLATQDPLAHTWSKTYGVNSSLATSTDPLGNTTTNTLDGVGNVIASSDPLGRTTNYALNSDGSIHTMTDALGRVTSIAYDQWGHQSTVTDNLGNAVQYTHDACSRLLQRLDAMGRVTSYSHDAWGRTIGVNYPTTGNPGITLSYDLESRLIQSSDVTGILTWQYDSLGRKVSATDPRGNTSAGWSSTSNLLWQTDVSGRKVSNRYNSAGQLTQVTDGSDNTSANITYTANGQINTVLYPNGIELAYTYAAAGRTTSITHTTVSTGSLVVGYNAQYAADGSILSITESPSGDVTTYQNDAAGNLLNERRVGLYPYSGAYSYFADNNRKAALVITNGVTVHDGAYSYDNGGRLIQVIDSATNLTEEYTWNADNTLATMPGNGYTREFGYNEESQLLSISHSGTLAYQYAYGADGNRRWAKDIANNKWTWYPCGVACGAGELVEQGSDLTGSTWSTNAQYLRAGGGCNSMLIRQKITNLNDEYHHVDPVGMFGVLTDASGNVLRNYVYDAFSDAPYKRQYVGESFPSQSNHTGTCQTALSEPGIITGNGGQGVVVPSRGFQVMGKKPGPAKKHACTGKKSPHKKRNDPTLQGGYQIAIECCDYGTQFSHDSYEHCVDSGCLVLHPLPHDAPGYYACRANAQRAFKSGCPHSPPAKIHWPSPGEVDPHHDGDPPKPGEEF